MMLFVIFYQNDGGIWKMEEKITCPLIDNLISPVDCMENQDLKEESIPEKFKKKEDWEEICENCQYQAY